MVESVVEPKLSHLFRPLNLLMIGLMMYFLRFGLLKPMLDFIGTIAESSFELQMTEIEFALLTLSVLLIAAGGYIVNDVVDVKADKFNNSPNPVGTLISKKRADLLYKIFTGSGLIIGFGVGFQLGNYNLGVIQFAAAISLWFYSYYFKNELVIGNLIVAFVVALVPLTVGIYEVTLIQVKYFNKVTEFKDFNFNFVAFWFIGYSVFVFLFTWAREILKDIEDIDGDRRVGAKTLPIQYGINAANGLVTLIYLGLIYLLINLKLDFFTDPISSVFIFVLVFILLTNIVSMWMKRMVWIPLSSWNKVMSVIGMFFLLALGYIINNELFFNA